MADIYQWASHYVIKVINIDIFANNFVPIDEREDPEPTELEIFLFSSLVIKFETIQLGIGSKGMKYIIPAYGISHNFSGAFQHHIPLSSFAKLLQ